MRTVAAYPAMGGNSGKMQRTEESVYPVLRKRTPKVSMAFATLQESKRRNFSSWIGSKWFIFIGSPDLMLRIVRFRVTQNYSLLPVNSNSQVKRPGRTSIDWTAEFRRELLLRKVRRRAEPATEG